MVSIYFIVQCDRSRLIVTLYYTVMTAVIIIFTSCELGCSDILFLDRNFGTGISPEMKLFFMSPNSSSLTNLLYPSLLVQVSKHADFIL